MAIISDGTTNISIDYVDERIRPEIEESTTRTAGGDTRRVPGGERLRIKSEWRLTPAQYRSILTLLTNNASNYFYTPEDSTASYWTDLYPSLTFPMNAQFTEVGRTWDNRSYWYVEMEIESTSYL